MGRKILIMVLSYDEQPYRGLMDAQQQTWAHADGATVVFYFGGERHAQYWQVTRQGLVTMLRVNASDEYYKMHWKFKMALDYCWFEDWDVIFRTNSSSYVNKKKLAEVIVKMPAEKLYAGKTMQDTNHDGGDCVSGAGIILSRDCAAILRNELKPEEGCEEDVMIGRILRSHGITAIQEDSRVDYPAEKRKMAKTYHIRFKTEDRKRDAHDMVQIHNKIKWER